MDIKPYDIKLVTDERTFQQYFNVIYQDYVTITKFRVQDVIITRQSVSAIFSYVNSEVEWIAFDPSNFYNIYPTLRVRSDGRLEIPAKVAKALRIRDRVERGETRFKVYVKYRLEPESVELTAYVSYSQSPTLKQEYKITKWYPVNFRYKNMQDRNEKLLQLYDDELRALWLAVFGFNDPFIATLFNLIYTGLTNRVKEQILKDVDYEKVRAIITDLQKFIVKYDYVFLRKNLLKALESGTKGWDTPKYPSTIYPQCFYNIFLDLDFFVLMQNNFHTIQDYINKHLKPTLQKHGINGKIYVFCSSYHIIPPLHNYHIIVQAKLTLEQWLELDKELIEHNVRKLFHRLQKLSVLRLSEKNKQKPFLITTTTI